MISTEWKITLHWQIFQIRVFVYALPSAQTLFIFAWLTPIHPSAFTLNATTLGDLHWLLQDCSCFMFHNTPSLAAPTKICSYG